MDLKSIFSREKAAPSTALPQAPDIRDMIEDIESCSKNDPVLIFAQILNRRGSRKSSVDSNISEAISASTGPPSMLRRQSNSESDSFTSSMSSTPHDLLLPGSNFLDVPGSLGTGTTSTDFSSMDATDAIYLKLRQFISISEQTQENTEEIEDKLRNFEQDNKEFLELLENLKGSR